MTLNNVVERGQRIVAHVKNGRFDYLRYALWVRWKGLDFSPVSRENLGFTIDSVHHGASGGAFLEDALGRVHIPPGSRVIDLGCGKGSALCTLAAFPFEELAGVDLSESLVRIAENNARKLGLKNLTFYQGDASHFTDYDRFTHIYMFNPFSSAVMERVMRNLAMSLAKNPRPVSVIYYHPVCDEVLVRSHLFNRKLELFTSPLHPYFYYFHDPARVGDALAIERVA